MEKTVFADISSRVSPYQRPKYSAMGMTMLSNRIIDHQNTILHFLAQRL